MANDSLTYKSIEGIPSNKVLIQVMQLYSEIFEDADLEFFRERCETSPGLFSVLAYHHDSLVGFKMGYRYSETVFYSWIGGVL